MSSAITGAAVLSVVGTLTYLVNPLAWTCLLCLGFICGGLIAAGFWLRLPSPSATSVRAKRFANTLIGHRGCRHVVSSDGNLIPENSMFAFHFAADAGADGVELDTRLTKDGVPVVMHDATAARLMEGSDVPLCDMTLAQVRKLAWKKIRPAADCPNPLPPGFVAAARLSAVEERLFSQPIPTLDEVMTFCAARRIKLMIEVKEVGRVRVMAAAIRDLFRKHRGAHEWAFVASFNPWVIWCVRQLDLEIETMMLYTKNLLYKTSVSGAETWPASVRFLAPLIDPVLSFAAEHVLPFFLGMAESCRLAC